MSSLLGDSGCDETKEGGNREIFSGISEWDKTEKGEKRRRRRKGGEEEELDRRIRKDWFELK